MARLIVVSNRVEVEIEGGNTARSSLSVALAAALRENNGLWFGWSGEQTEMFTGQIAFRRADGVASATIDLEARDVDECCGGAAAIFFAPLPTEQHDPLGKSGGVSESFARISYRFADTLAPLIEPEDVVWANDYHQIPLGQNLRARNLTNRMGFFLHKPWPPAGVASPPPSCRELLEAMFAYEVIGFQADAWRRAFVEDVTTHLGARVEGDRVRLGDQVTRLLVCPIGLDTADFAGAQHSLAAKQTETLLAVSAVGRDMIVGVDKLECHKGLPERFAAFALLLERYPELREKVSLLQIAPPPCSDARDCGQLRAQLSTLSGQINSAFASIDWMPVRFVNQTFARDELFGIYRAARVGLVTPLRDGVNLVADEYVAAQDPADPGVLVLSRFVEAAARLKEAVTVDPHNPEDMAEGIARALAMPLAERQDRHKAMLTSITARDVRRWSKTLIDALTAMPSTEDRERERAPAAATGG